MLLGTSEDCLPMRIRIFRLACAAIGVFAASIHLAEGGGRWSAEKAEQWSEKQPWLVGCNYTPRSAINQLEMWQAETFDPETIDEELGWAEDLGFTSIRVFLHHLPWEEDSAGFCRRLDRFLEIAAAHKIGVMFVLFDGVWDPFPKLGKQRSPQPGLHNSGWVQSPGVEILKHPDRHDELRGYVVGIVSRYRNDRRVQIWDLFNEPDNRNDNSYGWHEPKNKAELALRLLQKTFAWLREADVQQPLTAGIWRGDWSSHDTLTDIGRYMIEQSDIISFHSYANLAETKRRAGLLKRYGRPLLCTEYMARPIGSTFDPHLKYFRENKIGAYNWGFVNGKTQTIYPWDSWQKPYTSEPPVWFHDIFRADGTPYRPREVESIKQTTGKP